MSINAVFLGVIPMDSIVVPPKAAHGGGLVLALVARILDSLVNALPVRSEILPVI